MSEPRSAEIIHFPIAVRESSSSRGPERLSNAMAALDAALAAQRQAVAEWRVALADMQGSARGVGETMQTFQDGLDALGTRVATLRSEATRLARWSDRACTVQHDPAALHRA